MEVALLTIVGWINRVLFYSRFSCCSIGEYWLIDFRITCNLGIAGDREKLGMFLNFMDDNEIDFLKFFRTCLIFFWIHYLFITAQLTLIEFSWNMCRNAYIDSNMKFDFEKIEFLE